MTSILDQQMRQVLAELELCSSTPAARLERTSASSERGLNLNVDAPHIALKAEYNAAEDDEERRRVLRKAIRTERRNRVRTETYIDSKEWRQQVATAEGHVDDVAERWNLSRATVYRIRAEYNQAKKAA